MIEIPCILFRGGTSKGPVFLKSDLPSDESLRNKMLLDLMGSPFKRQIDGIGGGDSLSSKVAIVAPSKRNGVDIDYLFCQVHVNKAIVETVLNCGNMLSAAATYAVMQGMVVTQHPETTVSVFNENTGVITEATLQTPEGIITFDGDASIDGVPGTAAPIKLSFINPVGSKTGELLPTGSVIDEFEGIPVSCIDVVVPIVITYAEALGKTGYESKHDFDIDFEFLERLEKVREQAALKMGFGDVSHSICPKICIIAPPQKDGAIRSNYFTPFDCHAAHAVSGALCIAAACSIEGSVASKIAKLVHPDDEKYEQSVRIEHVSGKIDTCIAVDKSSNKINFPSVACIRTARPLFEGHVFVPN